MTTQTLREARDAYFEAEGLGDGGYDDKWVKLKLGPIPYAFPNTNGRVRAVRVHDLHHVVTGYHTDWIGEFEISAFEVASSCRDYWAAWALNLTGIVMGLLVAPRRVLRAFVRGRHAQNLYGDGYSESLVDEQVDEVRARLGLDQPVPEATAGDVVAALAWATFGVFVGLVVFVAPFVAPLVALGWWLAVA